MKVRVSSSSLAESHSICSATGAILVKNSFAQSDGTVTIENSSAEQEGGAVHLGAPSGEFRDVAWAGFEAVVCCGRFISVVVFRLRTSCLMDLLAQRFLNKSFREEVANSQIAALKNRCWYAETCDFQLTCQVEQYFLFWIISMLWKWRFPQALWQKATAFCSVAGAMYVVGTFTQSGGTLKIANSLATLSGGAVHLGAPSGEFRDVAWAGFEAVVCCGRFILVVVFRLRTSCLMDLLLRDS